MRAWYVAKQRPRILDRSTYVLFAASLVLILIWLLPREEQFRDMLKRTTPDIVALSYATLMAARAPNDAELAYLLALQLANFGRFEDALAALPTEQELDTHAMLFKIDLLEQLYFAIAEGSMDPASRARRSQLRSTIEGALAHVATLPDSTLAQLELIAATAARFEQPGIASSLYERIATTGDPEALARAARFAMHADQPERAARLYAQVLQTTVTSDAVSGALRAQRATDDLDAGVRTIRRLLESGNLPNANVIEAAELLLAAQANDLLRILLANSRDHPMPPDQRSRWMDLALAIGALELAESAIGDVLAAFADDPATRQKVARLLTWRGKPNAALVHWLWLLAHAPERAQLDDTVLLAQQLYRYDSVIDILEQIGTRRTLTPTETDALVHAHLEVGDPNAAVATIRAHLTANPEDVAYWRRGLNILYADEQHRRAVEWLEDMSMDVVLSADDLSVKARLHWLLYDLQEAYATLQQIDPEAAPDAIEHWRSLARLAWQLGDYPGVRRALIAYAGIQELVAEEYDMLLATFAAPDRDERRYYAERAWLATYEPRYLMLALAETFDSDEGAFHRLLRLAKHRPSLFDDIPLYWLLLARDHQRHGRGDDAWKAFARADALSPDDPQTVASVIWFLVDESRTTALASYLQRKARVLAHQTLHHPLAAGFALLGDYERSALYYKKALEQTPERTDLQLALADALLAAGRADAGYRLRRHLLRSALSVVDTEQTMDITLIQRAAQGLLTLPQFNAVFRRITDAATLDQLPTLVDVAMATLLDAGHVDALAAFDEIATRHNIEVDEYYTYYLAVQRRDFDQLQGYRDATSREVRAETLLSLRERPHALLAAVNGLHRTEPRRDALRQAAADLAAELEHGVQTRVSKEEFGAFTRDAREFRVAHLGDRWRSGFRRMTESLQLEDAPGNALRIEQSTTEISLARDVETGTWRTTASLVDDEHQSWQGLKIERDWQTSFRNGWQAALGYQQPAEATPLLRMFGMRDYIGAGSFWRISSRDVLSTTLRANRFRDRSGDTLGSGYEVLASYRHELFSRSPTLRLALDGNWMETSRRDLSPALVSALGNRNPEDLLPGASGQIRFSLQLERNEERLIARRLPSPHYRVEVYAGYEWPARDPTYGLSASIGTRIVGEDLLALGYRYDSRAGPAIDRAGGAWTLTYNYRLGK